MPPSFRYLIDRFEGGFRRFSRHIRLLQQLTLDAERAPRWTSRFIFPIGPAAIYTDLGRNLRRDRTNFTRTGELVYLMLCRSGCADRLRQHFLRLFDDGGQKNTLLLHLLPDDNTDLSVGGGSEVPFLPYKHHPSTTTPGACVFSVVSYFSVACCPIKKDIFLEHAPWLTQIIL